MGIMREEEGNSLSQQSFLLHIGNLIISKAVKLHSKCVNVASITNASVEIIIFRIITPLTQEKTVTYTSRKTSPRLNLSYKHDTYDDGC